MGTPNAKAESADTTSWRPVVYDPDRAEERGALEALFEDSRVFVHDTIEEQLGELVASLLPAQPLTRGQLDERVRAQVAGRPLADYGRWVFFPWARRLVHLLPPDEYFALRTDRNHHKITPEEQRRLREKSIGVIGLSVGQASVITLAMEGVGGLFRLADFDALSVSNMNRLRSGIHNVGIPKVVLAAREIFEIDPYAEVEIFPAGLQEEHLDAFFAGPPRLDLLVEECDDLAMKIRAREKARTLGIPVIMETSDRGMIDVERFDLDRERPLLHGLVGDLRAEDVRGMSTLDKIPYVMRILDDRRVSARIAASIMEVRQSISTWPQLASAVALGGAVVTDVARRILLGTLGVSGRYYVDLEELVGDGAAVDVTPAALDAELPLESRTRHIPAPAARKSAEVSHSEIEFLVDHATLAPSHDNEQPWRFEWTGAELLARLQGAEPGTIARARGHVALGAAAENLALAAGAVGLAPAIEAFPRGPESAIVFSARFVRSPLENASELFASIIERRTNRRIGPRRPLGERERAALLDAAREGNAELCLVEDDASLAAMSEILQRTERLRHLSPPLHRARMQTLRWTRRDAEATRTGVDVATLELDRARLAFLRLASRADAMDVLRRVDGGRGLTSAVGAEITTCSAVGMLRTSSLGPRAHFEGGRAMERVWLRATTLGLAVQPYDLVSLLGLVGASELPVLADDDLAALAQIGRDQASVFGPAAGTDVVVFRVAHLPPPSTRSLRRRVDEVLSFTGGTT